MASLTGCIRKAGAALQPEDKDAILERFNALTKDGTAAAEAARQAIDEQIAAVRAMLEPSLAPGASEVAAAPNADPTLDDELNDALGKLGDVLGDVFGAKKNITGPQYGAADLLPALSKVVELLVRKGFKSFAQSAGKAAALMRANEKTAAHVDAITPRQWKAAYNAIAEGTPGTDTEEALSAMTADQVKAIVSPADSGTPAAAAEAQNAPKEPTDGNATRPLDRPGQRALEGAPADPVQAPGAVRGAGGSAEGSRGADGGRLGDAEGASGPAGSMGDGAGALPVPARGTGRKPRGEPKPRAGRNARPDTEPGLFGDSAGPDPQELTAPNVAPPAPPAFTPTDFEITDDLALGEGGQKAKYRGNVEAIRLLRDLEATGRTATQAEQRVLARYVGWGGISQAFDGSNKDWAREYMELRELLTPEEWATANESTQYAHYTSREIIGGIYEALARMGFTGGKILEPGSGVGNFVGLMPAGLRTSSRFTGVEREALAVGIAKQLYPLQNIQRADFTEFIGNDGYFDLAIGNPPFARNPLTDKSGRKHLTGLSVHNYFFAKAVDMLREGGILAQVVSNSFLDAKRDTARRYIADRTEFLGAIRLPNNAFAKNANTEVTTDIVFLRKLPESEWGSRSGKENRDRWLDLAGIVDPEGGADIMINRYFQENPEMMLGRMGRFGTMYGPGQPALVARPGQDTAALLKAAIARLPANVYTAPAVANTAAATDAAIVALKNPQVQEGGHYVEGDKLYQRLQDIAGEARAVEITPATMWTEKTRLGDDGYARIKGLAGLRKTLRDLLAAELADSKDIAPLRKRLNTEYDAYVAKHGLINDRPSARVFDDDPDYPLLASLEHGFTPGITLAAARKMGVKPMPATAKKGPIFSARVIEKRTAPSRAESPADALNISMAERGRIDAGYIGSLLGRDGEEALREMSTGDKPLLFMDPASNEYVLRDAYLSGNVRAKLAQARQAGMMNNARALEAVQPPDVSAGEISVRVGSPWVPAGIYEDFARHLFGAGTKAKFTYVKANSSYMATISSGSDFADSSTWGTTSYPGTQILTSLMNNREIKVMFKDADGSLKVHKESTDAANQKATEIKQAFSDWAFADSDRADVLAKAYNEANNNYVTRAFDGAYMQFPGKVPDSIIKFRRHQRNAIARIVQDRTSLLDHVVGAGKTFTVISAAMELKRTGLANKPLIMVPNHLVKQWASDFYRLYPGANILTATKKDFEKTNRRRFLAKIATGNWDAVIMAHSSFGFIRPAPEFEAQFNEKQVQNVMATIKAVEDGDGDGDAKKRTVKQLAALKERLENRIDALRQKPIDALLDFKEIGVDQLFVDEAHLFKNLMFTTKMQNVRGLGDAAGSQRAYDLFIKANQLYAQNGRGQGVVFATGTPVSNSLAEMYHMMRYLMPQALQDGGFESFDAWANTFASVEQVWMQKISASGFKADNRMSNFVNTHELLKMFDQVADTVTMDDIKRAYAEENDGAEFPLPKLKSGRRQPVSLVKSAAQEAYMEDIAARAAAIEGKRTNEKGMDNALKIMGDARKAAMDIRLVDMNRTERDKGGRIDRAAGEIESRYRQYNSVKGTQLVFSDLGTPIKHAKAEMKEWEALQARIDKGVDPATVTAANLGNEAAMKTVDDAEDAQREMDEKGADWLDAVKAALRGFSVYDDMRAALVERGIPDAEIAFIHDYNTDEQKLSLFRKVNAGEIRVLIGSTPKLGAGTNVQERLVALHHLDVPWKPSDVEQREGRIIRQGNKLMDTLPGFEVEILAYVTQDTLDMRMWQVQETKLKMINQLRTRQISREIDNAFEDMEMSAGEMQAAATGNMDLLKEIQLRTDVKKLEQAKRSFDAQRNDLASRKKRAEEAVSALPAKIAAAEKMAVASKVYTDEQKAQAAGFKVTINGKTYTDPREAGAVLQGFVDAKQYTKKGSDEVLTPEQYQAMDEDERAASKGWQERPVPLKVEMDGKTYTARAALGEAFADIRGDAADPPMWKADGQTFIRRTKAAAAIAQRVADAIADSRAVEVGKIGPFAVTVEGQGENRYYEGSYGVEVLIAAPGGAEASTTLTVKGIASEDDARKAATSIINAAMSLASGGEMQARWLREDLAKQQKVLADLATAKTLGEFPQQAKLEEARAAHREVLARLAAKPESATPAGDDVAQPAQSRAQSNAGSVPARSLRAEVSKITATWDQDLADVEVVNRVEDLPADILQAVRNVGSENTVRGLAMPDGRVFLVAENISSLDEGRFVLFHETYGHIGMRAFLGDSYLRQMKVLRNANPALAKEADRWFSLYGEDEIAARVAVGFPEAKARSMVEALAVEEALADRAGNEPPPKAWKTIVAAIQRGLRRLGLGSVADMLEGMTQAETVDLLVQARRTVQSGQMARGLNIGRMPAYQRVWHGTPYRGIEQFSTDAIGTGEGAQAYGWGLYFAGKKEVADFYRKKLAGDGSREFSKDGKTINTAADLMEAYYKPGRIVRGYSGADKVLEFQRTPNFGWAVKVVGVKPNGEPMSSERPRWHSTQPDAYNLKDVLEEDGWKASTPGQLYEVDIPEDSEMLLWDKPLSEQSKKVRAQVAAAAKAAPKRPRHPFDGAQGRDRLEQVLQAPGTNGNALYREMQAAFGSDRAASEALRTAGIRGIKYLDGTSRNAGDGTFNYVIFDGADAKIQGALFSRRTDAQARAKTLGLPATGTAEQIARLVSLAEANPSTWTREDFDLIAPHLSVHQDLRADPESRIDTILSEGLTKGMVDNVGNMARGDTWTWSRGLMGKPAYVFISGALKYQGSGNPRLAPGNKPLFAITPEKGQGFYEALQTARVAPGALPAFSRRTSQDTLRDVIPPAVQEWVTDRTTSQRGFNRGWHRTVGTQLHKAKVNKEFGKAYYAVQDYMKDVSRMATLAADLAPDMLPQIETLGDLAKLAPTLASPAAYKQRKADIKAASDALFDGTLRYTRDESGEAVKVDPDSDELGGLVWTDAELKARGLSDRAVAMYRQSRQAIGQSLDNMLAADLYRQISVMDPEMVASDPGDYAGLMNGLRRAASSDTPRDTINQLQAAIRTRLGAIQTALDGQPNQHTPGLMQRRQELRKLQEMIGEKVQRIQDLKDAGYTPLMRFGPYAVDVVNAQGRRVYFGMYESQAIANKAARNFRGDGLKVTQSVMPQKQFEALQGVSPETAMLFAEMLGVEKNEAMQTWLKNAVAEQSALKRHIRRKGIEGFDDDGGRVLAAFITSNARAASRALHSQRISDAVENISQGDVQDEARALAEYVNNPKEEAQAIRSLLFVQYIGGSIASAIVNLTQTFAQTFPYLNQFGGGMKAGQRVGAAMKLALADKIPDAKLAAALARAERDGVVKPQEVFQLQAEASRSLGSNLYVRSILSAWGSMFQLAEQFNRRVAFIAAYNTAVEQKIADPFAFAENAVDETQSVFNKGNRPNWSRGAVGATLFTFKTFTIQYVEFLKRLATAGEPGSPERAAGQKAAALALMSIMVMAGSSGLPFADDLDDIIDTVAQGLGYNWTTKLQRDRFLDNLLGETFSGILQHGLSGVPGVPFDVSQRLGMANLLPGTGLLKQSEANKQNQVLEVFGVAGSAVRDATQGQFLPIAIRNLMIGLDTYETGMYRDRRGRNVTEADPLDAALKAIGLQPSVVARAQRDIGMQIEARNLYRAVKEEITDAWAQAQFQGDAEGVKKARDAMRKWNESNPDSRIIVLPQTIQQRVRQMRLSKADRTVANTPRPLRASTAEALQ